MTLLHDYFHLRNQQAFQRLLDGNADRGQSNNVLSSSGGKSWTKPSPLASNVVCNVNARDWLGRTVLQLASASTDTLEYVRLLLRHPAINVNLADNESHWTPLHRAMYHANFPAALLLLQRSDTDRFLKDLEGYTAFDLYNSTLNGTKPPRDVPLMELYTWGANRNAALGFGDGGDRMHPDQVHIQKKDSSDHENSHLVSRFFPIHVQQIQMSKLHTAVITSESGGNLRICGSGSGGRLGPGQHTQYSLKPLQQLTQTIISVALGQDHTLALTKAGEVLSWGLNRFSQLGYVIEIPGVAESFGKLDEPIQATPRKVQGPLRKEVVKGVAACKSASVCWTDDDVYTWGTNNGQLGYDKAAQAVQILPRKATKVTQPVIDVSISDSAMACLLGTKDVVCIWNDRHIKIAHPFPSEIQPYRPPNAVQEAKIAKITSCDDMFAALTFSGELFTFSASNPSDAGAASKEKSGFKPQRVWALRKKFSSVKDVALGSDGSIIVCTESGHVFVRTRNLKSGQLSSSGKAFKFQRLPALQRVVKVCANSTGAFGALRVEYRPKPIDIEGNSFIQDLTEIQPFLRVRTVRGRSRRGSEVLLQAPLNDRMISSSQHDEDADSIHIRSDIYKLRHILDIMQLMQKTPQATPSHYGSQLPHGADVLIQASHGFVFPAHQIILGTRSHVFLSVLNGSPIHSQKSKISLELCKPKPAVQRDHYLHLKWSGCQPITILILLTFLYTDEVLAPWDHRVTQSLGQPSKELKIDIAKVKTELRDLAELLELHTLATGLASPIKPTPAPSLQAVMQQLFETSQTRKEVPNSILAPDVVLLLSDREVYCHSAILRARSEFFANFFDDAEWTKKRFDINGVVPVDMKHLSWRVMEFVLRFMCFGEEGRMFDSLKFANTVDEVLEFMFDVMAAANELLLDRLVLLCSAVILQHVNINNACFVLADATHLHARQLIDRIQSFIIVNMELFLETGMLDDIPVHLVKQLSHYAQQKQMEKSPISRSDLLVNLAIEKHSDWLALQDFPAPLGYATHTITRKESTSLKRSKAVPSASPLPSPKVQPVRGLRHPPSNDDIFTMDEALPPRFVDQPLSSTSTVNAPGSGPLPTPPVWKATSIPRVDMKTVMAEAASATITNASRRIQEPMRGASGSSLSLSSPHAQAHAQAPLASSLRSQKSQDLRQVAGGSGPGPAPGQPGPSSSRAGSTGWRVQNPGDQPRPSPPTTPSKNPNPSVAAALAGPTTGSAPRYPPSPSTPRRTSATATATGANTTPGLGPVITPMRQTPSSSTTPGLGPVITPTRQPLPSSSSVAAASSGILASPSIRRTSGKAWTQPQPLVAPALASACKSSGSPTTNATVGTGTGRGMSLVAIQQLEMDLLADGARGAEGRRSLREIQEEERARQAEEDFLAWWTAEEERVRLETQLAEAEAATAGGDGGQRKGSGGRRPGGRKGKVDQGREPTRESAREGGKERPSGRQEQVKGGPPPKRKPRNKPGPKTAAAE
ncbi:hypothetical protein H0H92_003189 [Tricholoma furcatifolium]|nr:hypothetical protein H0H92_003189 [Tricholoma furcatifolium]